MNKLTRWQFAGAIITKIHEQESKDFSGSFLFPQWNNQQLAGIADRLTPGIQDLNHGTVALSTHSWLVQRGEQVIIIDTAAGNDKERPDNPKFHHMQTRWMECLRQTGITPQQVTAVLMTHLHVDHVGWNTLKTDGGWQPAFPNARYYFSRQEREFYSTDSNVRPPSRGALQDSVLPVIQAGLATEITEQDSQILDGITVHRTPGHSIDHYSFSFTAGEETAIFPGDVMHHPLQISLPEWNSVFCEQSDKALESRKSILELAAQPRTMVFSSHFPASSAGQIIRDPRGLLWHPANQE